MGEAAASDDRSERVPALVVPAADGELVEAAGVAHLFKLTGRHTGGLLGVEELLLPPLTTGARPHVHHAHDETFYVLAGAMTVLTDVGERVLAPGDLAHAPRGSVHGYLNADDRTAVRALCLYTPPGYEQYFRDVHAAEAGGQQVTPELLAALRSRYRTESL